MDGTKSAATYHPDAFDAALLAGIGSTTIGITMTDPQGQFLWVNPAFRSTSGYGAPEFGRMTVYDITHPEDVDRLRDGVGRLVSRGTPGAASEAAPNMAIEFRYIAKNGMWLWACVNMTLIRDVAGQPSRVVSIVEDMTPRVRGLRDARRVEQVSAALAAAITPDDVAAVIAEHAVAALGASAGAFFRLREDGRTLDLVRESGYGAEWRSVWRHIPTDASLPLAEVIHTGSPIFIESESEWGSRFDADAPLRGLAGSRAWAALPLVAEGRVLGALGLSFQKRRRVAVDDGPRFDSDTRRYMVALAQQCAQAAERARLYQAERHARADAETANAAKSEFLAAMSHEIRTPINAIQGYAQLLELGLAGPVTEYQRTYLTRLASSSHHLLGLVDDVLDLAKVDAGEMRVAHELADAGQAIDTALDVTRPLAAARGVRLVDDRASTGVVRFVGDAHRVRQILINLLTNAIKFTNAGGTVTVQCGTVESAAPAARVRGQGPWAFIRVDDTGIGIAPANQAVVFDAFHQVERGATRTRGGTGLGLTISRRLARLLGGDLTLESAPGAGSSFTVWLPSGEMALSGRTETTGERTARGKRLAAVLSMPGLADVGASLLRDSERILESFVARLRADPLIPGAQRLRSAPLEDHAVTMLSDIAQTLVIIGEAGPDAAALLRDGSAIQRVVAETHGVRRQAMGWGIEALRRELDIFRDIVVGAVHGHSHGTDDRPEDTTGVLIHLVDRASAISRRAWHRAAHGPGTASIEGDPPSAPDIADLPPPG